LTTITSFEHPQSQLGTFSPVQTLVNIFIIVNPFLGSQAYADYAGV